MAAGYAYLQQGSAGLWTVPERGHPVLFNALEALPIYIAAPDMPVTSMQGWGYDRRAFTTEFIHTVQNFPAISFAGRLPSILCTVLLGAVLWRGTTDIWGEKTGLLALLILCLDPLILAHGRLATNDLAVTSLGWFYLYCTWRWGRKPSWKRSILLGGLLGITMLTKATGIFFGAVGLMWSLWIVFHRQKSSSSLNQRLKYCTQLLVIGSLALGLIWAAYGFSIGPTSAFPTLPLPAPEHWEGVFFQADNTVKRDVFAFGLRKTGRWWWYFSLAFLLKNPLPLLIVLVLSFFFCIEQGLFVNPRQPKSKFGFLLFEGIQIPLFFSIVYTCAAVFIFPNIGYRHFLPIHPVLYLCITGACNRAWDQLRWIGRTLLLGLGLWYAVGTLIIFPNEISFFNELAGGPDQGWRYLTTSNTDWLQGWTELRNWQQKTGIQFRYTGPEGYLGLADYGIHYEPLPPVKGAPEQRLSPWLFPLPGDYIIGSSILSGMNVVDVDNYSWFRYHQPDAIVAHSLYYYKITPEQAPLWVAQCNKPILPLEQNILIQGYGERQLRILNFDCTKSWIYPEQGQSNGHYILHGNLLSAETWRTRLHLTQPTPLDSFTARHLKNVPMAARERRDQQFPSFGVYAWSSQALSITTQAAIAASVEVIPQDLTHVLPSSAPQTLNASLTFLGIKKTDTTANLEVETYWRVEEPPSNRPLSLMAHLLTEDGQTIGIADGLDVSPLMWQTGDVIIQRHTFDISCEEHNNLWLRTGVYWLDNLERWTVDASGHDSFFVSLCDNTQ